ITFSGGQGNSGPTRSQSDPASPSEKKAEQNGKKSERSSHSDGRKNIDGNEPPPPTRNGNHPVTPADAVASASLLDHLITLNRIYGLRPERVGYLSDFLSEQLGIPSLEKFETLFRQCQPTDGGSETLYDQMLRGFDPKNQQHMMLASKALQNSLQVIVPEQVIVPDGQKYHCYNHDKNHNHSPHQSLGKLEDLHIFLFHENHVVKLSHRSDNNAWFTHFLTGSRLNNQGKEWPGTGQSENALWELFPQWQKDILLCWEGLCCQSITSASEVLKQVLTAPDEFMREKDGHNLFRFYNQLGLVCYPFDDTENPDGTLYISKNVLGSVVFFWQDSASKYISFIAPDLSTSTINDKLQSFDDHLKNYSEGAFLVKKQDIRYVVPALVVLAPVFRKTYAEARRIISDTEDALIYGGSARWQHLASSVKPTELGKVPVTNDIDLAVEDITRLETISASLEDKLRRTLPGTFVRRNNIYTMVLASPKESQGKVLLHTLKINCFPGKNRENTIGYDHCQAKKWRILSIDISAGPEGYFDFMRVEPFATGSKLLIPSLPAMVEKLLRDTQLEQTYPGIDSKRRVQNAENALKIMLASDTEQQVQAIIQRSLFGDLSESFRLPEFLHPYIKPKPDNKQESNIKAENNASEQPTMVAAQTKITAPGAVEPSAESASGQNTIDEHAAVATITHVEDLGLKTEDLAPGSCKEKKKKKKKNKQKKTIQPEISNHATAPEKNDIEVAVNPDDQQSTVAHNNKKTAPDPVERSKERKQEAAAQKSVSNMIDFETALSQSIEISNWLTEVNHNFSGELNRAIKTQHCESSEENPTPNTKLGTLQNQLEDGKTKTLQILACSGVSVDTSGDQPVITINLANTLGSQQRTGLEQAAYENHFPYAQLVQALFILNQKLPSGKSEALKIYEKAFELLLPAAIAGIPLAYQLLIGMQLHNHHPAGWPQMEPVNRLLRSMASRETSFSQIKIEGALNGGFLEQLYQDTDVITLTKIEQGLAQASDLSARGKEVKA
ncbi:hypothetical protein, partial [Endozoicomonas sp. ISHI1]|uniref:hypothetical protein n=1 Tax=Endozoicomonas sp. ISHI1 TaxID=2825882 RepID=UPI0021493D44